MDRLEMAKKLFENPKLKARDEDEGIVYCDVDLAGYKTIKWKKDEDWLYLIMPNNEKWEIIEPSKKLKEMTYGEISYILEGSNKIYTENVKSIITGNTLYNNLTLEEYMGLWTIDGIYEEEE